MARLLKRRNVAGPIERSTHLLPQFYKKINFDYRRASDGLMLWGIFKKKGAILFSAGLKAKNALTISQGEFILSIILIIIY